MARYAFVILYTDCVGEVNNEVQDVFEIELTENQRDELETKISNQFSDDGNGNDCWYSLVVKEIKPFTVENLKEYKLI